jgi:hypothetical protein
MYAQQGADLEVGVLRELGHRDSREPQGRAREGSSEGSGERTDGPTNRNRIRGDADQGERACDREALVTKDRQRKSGGRVGTVSVLIWGDLASRLKGRRDRESRSEKSAEAVVVVATPRRAKRWTSGTNAGHGRVMRQKTEQLELALEARGEAPQGQRSGEAPTTSDGDERSGGDHRHPRD